MESTDKSNTNIKKGDTVFITSGKEKGKIGKVLRVMKDENKAIIEKLNIIKRHTRPSGKNPSGGIVEKEAGIHTSNLMLYCTKCSKPSRVGHRNSDKGEKIRYCKRCGEEIKS